jgi:glycosyltransferase involved in cell wall biosynthesis
MPVRLTIAIPTYNRHALLRRALESALAQTSDRIEILVSDNGSTDDTPNLIAGYRDRRLRAVRREVTVPRALHGALIFDAVTTELVLVLSDDDYIDPDFSREVLELFDAHPEVSFAYTGCLEHYDDQAIPALVGPRVESTLDFMAAHYAGKRHVFWCACVTRVADLRRFGPQPEDRICGDMFFWTRIAFLGPVGCVSRPLAHYTALLPGGDNESRTTPIIAWAQDVSRLADEVKLNIERTEVSESYRQALKTDMGRYLTRSIANQFVWARIHGMSRIACLRVVGSTWAFKGWHTQSMLRVLVALVLSRKLLRSLVVQSAARMSASRRNGS